MLTLYGYWRSSASYRVRIALNLKGLTHDTRSVDLRTGEQAGAAYAALNPSGLVPTLLTEHGPLAQSPAIIELLEARYPEPSLLPPEPLNAAHVRAAAQTVACDAARPEVQPDAPQETKT